MIKQQDVTMGDGSPTVYNGKRVQQQLLKTINNQTNQESLCHYTKRRPQGALQQHKDKTTITYNTQGRNQETKGLPMATKTKGQV